MTVRRVSGNELTVHMVGNAHLDPVWLWRRGAGIDATIATCRTACDLLDAYPEPCFTKADVWAYAMLEQYAPDVLARVAGHAQSGRWCPVGGWWVQPDCNFPLRESFHMQARLGQQFLARHFGRRATVGYNVDSFGHTAYLPSMLQQMDMPYYVFMRPGRDEMTLPDGPFRWRSPDGAAVTAFRIVGSYATQTLLELQRNIEQTLESTPAGAAHTMCFYGVGDHGGGPTREQVEWISQHKSMHQGVRLAFSDPARFFASLTKSATDLPEFGGELQQHAIGCYSVDHGYRQTLRRSERLALQVDSGLGEQRDALWQQIAFGQFHDLAGGCSTPSAMAETKHELDSVIARCQQRLTARVRRMCIDLPPEPLQRVLLHNPADRPLRGPLEIEPWLGYPLVEDLAHTDIRFLDESGAIVASQAVVPEAAALLTRRFLVDCEVTAGGRRVLRVVKQSVDREVARPGDRHEPARSAIECGGFAVDPAATGIAGISAGVGRRPLVGDVRLTTHADPTDTWSHGLDRYAVEPSGTFEADGEWVQVEHGPLRWRMVNRL